jgi:hypothetical protein
VGCFLQAHVLWQFSSIYCSASCLYDNLRRLYSPVWTEHLPFVLFIGPDHSACPGHHSFVQGLHLVTPTWRNPCYRDYRDNINHVTELLLRSRINVLKQLRAMHAIKYLQVQRCRQAGRRLSRLSVKLSRHACIQSFKIHGWFVRLRFAWKRHGAKLNVQGQVQWKTAWKKIPCSFRIDECTHADSF